MKRLGDIQQELKAHKGQRNTFGNYDYRSCEDILEAVKPLLLKNKLIMTLDDEMIEVGGRVYVKATARLYDDKNALITEVTANACESESKKGMDSAQITGAASSYARKYALNGLFLIDDTKDADTQDNSSTPQPSKTSSTSQPAASGSSQSNSDNPWFNDFNKQRDNMIDRIGSGEQTGQQIIDALSEKYKLSKKTKEDILALEAGGDPF